MKTNPTRRVLFFALAALLFVAFLAGFDASADLSSGRIGGTIFYAVLFLICFGVAVFETRYVFDAEDRCVRVQRRVSGFLVSSGEVPFGESPAIVVQQIQLLKGSEQPQRVGMLGGRMRNFATRRNKLGKLVLETDEKVQFFDDSADVLELENTGQAIAEFLQIPYRKEDI